MTPTALATAGMDSAWCGLYQIGDADEVPGTGGQTMRDQGPVTGPTPPPGIVAAVADGPCARRGLRPVMGRSANPEPHGCRGMVVRPHRDGSSDQGGDGAVGGASSEHPP